MAQVLFLQRTGAHWPGANPVLSDERAAELIKAGVCVPYSEAARAKLRALLPGGHEATPLETVTLPPEGGPALRPAADAGKTESKSDKK